MKFYAVWENVCDGMLTAGQDEGREPVIANPPTWLAGVGRTPSSTPSAQQPQAGSVLASA